MSRLCFVITCMGRLPHLQRTLQTAVSQFGASCVVVDYSCPQRTGDWVAENFPHVTVVREPGHERFNVSHARNLGARATDAPWLCFRDADVLLAPTFGETMLSVAHADAFHIVKPIVRGLRGLVVCSHSDFERVGRYDEILQSYGSEDDDLYARLRLCGLAEHAIPAALVSQLTHDDRLRVQFFGIKNRHLSNTINDTYVQAKLHRMKVTGQPLGHAARQDLYDRVGRAVMEAFSVRPEANADPDSSRPSRDASPSSAEGTRKVAEAPRIRHQPAATPVATVTRLAGDDAPAPFIVGASRSGTTLLRLMLDAHPDLAIPPETHFFPKVAWTGDGTLQPAENFLDCLTTNRYWGDHHFVEHQLRERVMSLDPFDLGSALRCFYGLYAEQFGKRRFGDKTPYYLFHMTLIQASLPEARFLHIVRDGRDVALSVKGQWWGPQSVAQSALWWAQRIRAARLQARQVRSCLEIRYEDLVREPEQSMKKICGFLDLPWHAGVLEYHRHAADRLSQFGDLTLGDGTVIDAARRRAIHERALTPPDPSRMGRWKSEMSAEERGQFELLAGPVLSALGYEVS